MKAVVSVGDLHTASRFGLLPPNFQAADEGIVSQNPVQKYLWECWDAFWTQVSTYPVAAVVVNGDMIDGLGKKLNGGESCLSTEADQARAAVECLKFGLGKLKNKPRVYGVSGTGYHVGTLGREEEAIAKEIGMKRYKGEGNGHYIKEVLNLQIDGVTGNFAHHVSFAPVNKTAPIDKELQGALMAELDSYPKIDYLVRNHVHYYRSVGAGYRHGATSPAWQIPTQFGRRNGVFKFRPDIGGLVVWVDGEAKIAGDDPVRIQPILYSLPVPKVEVVRQ